MSENLPKLSRKGIGILGERLARVFLQDRGYKILTTNFHIRGGEIDIIATIKEMIVFVEVKTRTNYSYGVPEEAVGYAKLEAIKRTALWYLTSHTLTNHPYRVDVIAIECNECGTLKAIRHHENVTS